MPFLFFVLSRQFKTSSIFVATSKNVLWLNSFVFLQLLKCQMDLKTVHGTGYHFSLLLFLWTKLQLKENDRNRRYMDAAEKEPDFDLVPLWRVAGFSWRHILNIFVKIRIYFI